MVKQATQITQTDFGGVRINVFHCAKGEGLPRHEHPFNHLTICTSGSIVVRKEGKEKVLKAGGTPLDLAANEWHEVEALEDGTSFTNVFTYTAE